MATAIFEPGMESAKTEDLWQYDYGQILRIEGLELPSAAEIHFSTQKKEGEAERRVGVTKDGATEVRIPDSMLENQGSTSSYSIYAFIYLADETSGKTIRWTQTRVKPRPKPAPERPDEEGEDLFREAIRAVNDAAGGQKLLQGKRAFPKKHLPQMPQKRQKTGRK